MRAAIVHAARGRTRAVAGAACHKPHRHLWLWLWLCCLLGPQATADPGCRAQARDGYEQLYCKIKAEGGGAGLPSLADFRRNPPQTQALLLRRPAQRLGLEMPEPPKPLSAPLSAPPVATPAEDATTDKDKGHESSSSPAPAGLAGCVLDAGFIRCDGGVYQLLDNRPRSALAPDALKSGNRLRIPPYQGAQDDERALRDYLRQAYAHYVDKMLSLGLAGSTMSFTKFYYTYREVKRQDADFSGRMAQMFDYLKQDRKTLAVRRQHSEALPQSLEACGRLNSRLIICDRGDKNWIFQRR